MVNEEGTDDNSNFTITREVKSIILKIKGQVMHVKTGISKASVSRITRVLRGAVSVSLSHERGNSGGKF